MNTRYKQKDLPKIPDQINNKVKCSICNEFLGLPEKQEDREKVILNVEDIAKKLKKLNVDDDIIKMVNDALLKRKVLDDQEIRLKKQIKRLTRIRNKTYEDRILMERAINKEHK
jgi:uncharacterized protein YfkK (UPF0435 family)